MKSYSASYIQKTTENILSYAATIKTVHSMKSRNLNTVI